MEDKIIIKRKVKFNIYFIIVFTCASIGVCAQTEMDSKQEQQVEEIDNSTKSTDKPEILELFTVDNNTYKVLNPDKDDNIVIFWKCADDLETIIVNNEVYYNGRNLKVNYVYEKAFSKSKSAKNVIIGDDVAGFCDSFGSLVETLDGTFKDKGKLESIDFGGSKFIFGESCFQNCSSIKNIDLSRITKFNGQSNFFYCKKLEDIGGFNDEVIELPTRTFTSCSKLKINSLNKITKLGDECFKSCRLLDKNIVTGVEEIGDNCFFGCYFSEVYLEKAKKVGYNAFGGIENLRKIKFGNPNIPILGKNIAEGSSINEWVYPLNYKNQSDYSEFLRNLRISKVIWYHDSEKLKWDVTQDVRLNSLKPPTIAREGYEIEGWYKDSNCTNKVNMIADLGEIIGSDLVIKDPKLYAKWIAKEFTIPKDTKDPSGTKEPSILEDLKDAEEPSMPEGTKDPSGTKEPSIPEDQKNPSGTEEPSIPEDQKNPSDAEEPSIPEDPKDSSDSEEPRIPEDTKNPSDAEEPSIPEDPKDLSDSEEPIILENTKDSSDSKSPTTLKESKKTKKTKKTKNNFIIKFEGENKDVDMQENNEISLENEIIKNCFVSSIERNNAEIQCFNWSYIDKVNSNIEIIKSGTLSKINKNNKCIGIYLKSNDYFKNNTIIEMNIENIIAPNRLYFYSEELGKFILIDENLQINNDIIKFKPTSKKEYLITKFDLNEDIVAVKGWNKILPEQSNALLGKQINELSWIYIQGEELSKGWIEDAKAKNWYFMNEKGIMETGWLKDKDDKWYYLNTRSDGSKGSMKIGWNKINNEWYYLQNDGVLAVNTIIDGYLVGSDGKLI